MTRSEICEHLKHHLLGQIVAGSFVRVVSNNNTYRLCRVLTTSKAQTSYEVNGKRKKLQTRIMLVCAVGKQRKTLQLNMVSNQTFTVGEFNAYKKSCLDDGLPNSGLPTADSASKVLEGRQNFITGSLDPKELENLVRERFEQNLRLKNFAAISNIPFELSRLHDEIE